MNLAIQKLKEINKTIKDFDAKQISREDVQTKVSLFNAAHKWAHLIVHAYAIESKNRRIIKTLTKTNILDDYTALELTDGSTISCETIKCPINDSFKTKEQCLDFSGEFDNIDICKCCEHHIDIKNELLGEVK
jgi:hypothetical protein